jgi:nitrate/nitrite transporter NarK
MLAFPAAVMQCAQDYKGAAIGLVTTCGYLGAGVINLIVPMITGEMTTSTVAHSSLSSDASGFFAEAAKLSPSQLESVASFQWGMIPLMITMAMAILASLLLKDSQGDHIA